MVVTGQVKLLPKTGLLVLRRKKRVHYSQHGMSQISRHVYSNTYSNSSDTDLLSHHFLCHSFVWLGDCWKPCHTYTHAHTFYTVCTAGGKNNESINFSFWQELQISKVIANYWYRGDFYSCSFFQGCMTHFKHFHDMVAISSENNILKPFICCTTGGLIHYPRHKKDITQSTCMFQLCQNTKKVTYTGTLDLMESKNIFMILKKTSNQTKQTCDLMGFFEKIPKFAWWEITAGMKDYQNSSCFLE